MIEPHDVKDGGVEIVNVNDVFLDSVANIIRLAVYHTGPDSTSGQPTGESLRMMVPASLSNRSTRATMTCRENALRSTVSRTGCGSLARKPVKC